MLLAPPGPPPPRSRRGAARSRWEPGRGRDPPGSPASGARARTCSSTCHALRRTRTGGRRTGAGCSLAGTPPARSPAPALVLLVCRVRPPERDLKSNFGNAPASEDPRRCCGHTRPCRRTCATTAARSACATVPARASWLVLGDGGERRALHPTAAARARRSPPPPTLRPRPSPCSSGQTVLCRAVRSTTRLADGDPGCPGAWVVLVVWGARRQGSNSLRCAASAASSIPATWPSPA